MDPDAVRRSLEPTASAEEITGSTPARLHFYDPFVLSGVSIESAEHGRLLCSFVIAPRHASPAGYLRSGVTATLADQLGSAVFFCSGLRASGVSVEISVSFVDAATVGEEIEVEGKLLRAGKSVGVVSVDFRKKKTGKLMAQARHTKYFAVSSKL
ncbi:acyl-coenzyme A thioesterase 13-like [Panicum miliaceum]|uniref:Acyl-coenzyme A thioesterase 13 n=1 Tax=Panicum miliaceum TaxID=4540 RepID=A0A3L6QAP7_PANMI|nr:acyl-coenzyme A thioesterase 13-like [Panicum miliaceum]